jgi:ribonuclease-3
LNPAPEQIFAKKLGVRFQDGALLKEALTHRSAGGRHNERLEFLGDSILGYVIAEALYRRFPDADEGILSRLRASLVNQTSLAGVARGLGLGDFLILGSGELKSGGFRRDSILSDALEAVIGALLLDQGVEACRETVLEWFAGPFAGLNPQDWQKDPKTRLQEVLQGRGLGLPVYRLLAQVGLPHEQTFEVECEAPVELPPTVAVGPSRKRAEQQAAEAMLARIVRELGWKA